MKKPLSRPQIVCLLLLWIVLCFLVLTTSPRLDGPVILSLLISGALVFIPLYKMLRKK
ncbi:MAG: hypothetical protein ACI36X_08600 [Bacteroidaceae bacterium]